jgi:hypothetical protein
VLRKEFTVTDLDGKPVQEVWYFSISIAELAKMEMLYEGGFQKYLQTIIASKDAKVIMATFDDLIAKSVGRRTENARFMKSPEATAEFMGGDAYSEFFLELVTNANAGVDFIKGILPGDLAQKAAAIHAQNAPEGEQRLLEAVFPQEAEQRIHDAIFAPEERTPLTTEQFGWEEMMAMSDADLRLLGEGKLYDKPGTRNSVEQYTRQELLDMDEAQFVSLVGNDAKKWPKPVMVIAMQRRANARK